MRLGATPPLWGWLQSCEERRLREGRVANPGQSRVEWAGFYVAPERDGKPGPKGGKGLGVRPGRRW